MNTVIEALPREVIKRDGHRAAFDSTKIRSAILRAGQASGEFGEAEADLLTAQVAKVLIHSFRNAPPDIERIQDVVEQSLIASNHFQTARGYIAYRESHKKLREDRKTLVDVEASVNEYLSRQDWRVNANANQGYSLGGLILNVSGKVRCVEDSFGNLAGRAGQRRIRRGRGGPAHRPGGQGIDPQFPQRAP